MEIQKVKATVTRMSMVRNLDYLTGSKTDTMKVPGWEYLMVYRKDNYLGPVFHSETSSGGHSQPGSGLQWDGD